MKKNKKVQNVNNYKKNLVSDQEWLMAGHNVAYISTLNHHPFMSFPPLVLNDPPGQLCAPAQEKKQDMTSDKRSQRPIGVQRGHHH